MGYDIGPRIGIDGEAEFRQGLNQMTQHLRTLGTEMNVVTSTFGRNATSQEALTAKNEVLSRQLTVQREKLDRLKEGLARSAELYGANDERTLRWQASVNTAQTAVNRLTNQIEENNDAMHEMGDGVEQVGDALDDAGDRAATFGDVLKANILSDVILSGLKKLGDGLKSVFETAFHYNAQMETYTSNFTVMLGDAEKAARKVEELKEIASKTPFELGDLADATKTLLAFQVTSEDSAGVLQQLGDISLGNAEKLSTLVSAYGKMNSSGKVTLEAINMMIDAGYNPLNNIAQQTGEHMEDLYGRISAGAVSFAEIQQAIAGATAEGGQFYQGMQQASTTTDGLISTLKDNINATLGGAFQGVTDKIRTELLPAAIEFIDSIDTEKLSSGIVGFLDALQKLTPMLVGATTAMLAYKTASAISGLIDGLRRATEGQTIAQAALNVVMNANPFVLIATLISGLVAALITLYMTNEDFRNKVQEVWKTVTTSISTAVGQIHNFFTVTIPNSSRTALNWFKAIPESMKQVGKNLIVGLWNGISDKIQWLKSQVTGVVNKIKSWFTGKEGFDEHSPSRWAKTVFQYVMEGGENGLQAGAPKLYRAVGAVVDNVRGTMSLNNSFSAQMQSVTREMESAIPMPTASYGSVANSDGGSIAGSDSVSGLFPAELAGAMREAMSGMAVYMDGKQVGVLVSRRQSNTARATGGYPILA